MSKAKKKKTKSRTILAKKRETRETTLFDECQKALLNARVAKMYLEFTSPICDEVVARATPVAGHDELHVAFEEGYAITPMTLKLILAWVEDLQKPSRVKF